MGVVADDVTGSNDIGIMFAKEGCLTHVYEAGEAVAEPIPDIVILNTNSRLDPPEVAYQKVFAATRKLQASGCRRFHNKTCSVFRGNIGAEFDAMLDALGLEFAVVVLGFPKNGRTTVDGIHYVHGKKLQDSEFRDDPIHPMRQSNLVEILQAQTRRKVAALNHKAVARGPRALRAEIEQMRPRCQYLILDVTGQVALKVIAAAVAAEAVLCGSSAIAEELPAVWGVRPTPPSRLALPAPAGTGILITAGSLMPQTAAQIEHLRNLGAPVFVLDTARLFDPDSRAKEIEALAQGIAERLGLGQDVVLQSPNLPQQVEAARQKGRAHGYKSTETARLVSGALAEVTAAVLAQAGQNRLVVAGGETSAAVCERLGVRGMRVWREIQPGLPSCLSLNDPPRLLVLKSGSFGQADFFQRALEHLREP
jgi:uncharacterized protein YgbK (DUF1537 family)